VLAWLSVVLIGLLLGAASAWGALAIARGNLTAEAGAWRWSRAAGSPDADSYTRALVARDALLALNAEEAIYLTLDRDENGKKLQESCIYEIAGAPIPARWWSVTLYAPDNYLAQNNDNAASVDSTHVGTDGDGRWSARISSVRGDATAWISSRAARRGFVLMLRAYNADSAFPGDGATLPTLRTISCPDTAS
jgi:hypothetical protein